MLSRQFPCIKQIFNTMKTFKSLAIAVSSLCVIPTVAQAKDMANDAGMAMMRLNASALSDEIKYSSNNYNTRTETKKSYGGSVWTSLRNDFRMAEVNSSLVRSHENKFANNSAYFNRTLNRSKPYMYHIVQEVKKRGMPAEIALLPFIESAYVTKASSHVGASGLWQFMPATGRHYGLEQTPLYDGRHDVYAATDAALNYLQYLHGLFGDWSLALAAYNWGEGNVTRAVRRAQASGMAPTYENLKMPAETSNYVPKLLAVRNLVRNPQAFGLDLPDIQNSPYFKAVTVNNPVDIMAAAHLANISESEFLALNPAFKTPVFIPKNGRKMLLPVAAASTFEANYKNNDSKSMLSWDVFTPSYSMSLSEIAAQTGTDINELRRLNGLNGSRVSAGRSVLVAKNGNKNTNAIAVNFVSVDKDDTPDTFVEQKQPIITNTNFVAQTKPTVNPFKAEATSNAMMVQQNFILNQPSNTDFTSVAKNTVQTIERKNEAAPAPIEAVTTVAASKVETAPATPVASAVQTPTAPVAFNNVQMSAEEMALIDAEINGKAASQPLAFNNNAAALEIDLPDTPASAQDPLLSLANEKAKALKEAKAAKAAAAKAKREAAEREKAARLAAAKREAAEREKAEKLAAKREAEREKAAAKIAEAKEAKRKEQELARAEKLKQAQELAALRRAREAGEPISKAIREQKQAANATTHRVREGDTLFNIAQRYNLNVADLVNANNLRGNSIRVGQVLKVSGVGSKPANNQSSKNPITKVSARTSTVMGLSRGVSVGDAVGSNSSNAYGIRKNGKRVNDNRKTRTGLIPS